MTTDSIKAAKALLKSRANNRKNVTKKSKVSNKSASETKGEAPAINKRSFAEMDELNWKPIDITSRNDDLEGFFGLEELDGVTVERTKDGRLQFIEKQSAITKDKKEGKQKNDKKKQDNEDNIEDITEAAADLKRSENKKKADKKEKKNKPKKLTKEAEKPLPIDDTAADEEDLSFNPFNALEKLPQVDTSALEWDFEDSPSHLSQMVLTSLAALKYNKPTEIQRRAIPEILAENDVVGKATTGSGKTLAYGIPILERHMALSQELAANSKDKNEAVKAWPTGLIFAPTRELAHQIVKHISEVAKYCPIMGSGIVPLTGGLSIQKQQRLIQHKPAIVVATPGRFLELIGMSQDTLATFKKAEMLVLDEADRMLQDGHFKEMGEILDLLGRGKTSQRQTLVFSATFQKDFMNKLASKKMNKHDVNNKFNSSVGRLSTNDEALEMLKKKLQFKDRKPVFIDANPTETVASKVHESIIECGNMEKDLYLYYFTLLYPGRTIVFVNSIDAVKRITPLLQELGLPAVAIHSNMIQKQRLRSLERFRANERGILIATDVAARGLDIPLIQHVVHYHLPRTADMYVHRSGRTARAGTEGVSVLLCAANEASGPLVKLRKVLYKDKLYNNTMHPFDIDYDVVSRIKERVSIAKKITDSRQESTYKGKDTSWIKEAAEDLGVDLDSDFDDLSDEDSSNNKPRPKGWTSLKGKKKDADKILSKDELQGLKNKLKQLLSRPVTNQSGKYLTSGRINLAHMVLSGQSHEAVLGMEKTTALKDIGPNKKRQKTK
jgi:ATP-dependent RNA helicase DDX24/MAK5